MALAFEDHVGLFLFHDVPWTGKGVAGTPALFHHDVQNSVRLRCEKYRSDIEHHYRSLAECSGLTPREALEDHLFRPVFYIPFGSTNLVTVLSVDDFDPVRYLTAGVDSIAQLSVGLNPKINRGELANRLQFRTVAQMLTECRSAPGEQSEFPAFIFTRFKISGITLLSAALSTMAAAFQQMARVADETLTRLRIAAGNSKLYDTGDIDQCRICLLSLLGPEEIGLFILGTNFSVGMEVIASLRAMRVESLFESDLGDSMRAQTERGRSVPSTLELFEKIHSASLEQRGLETVREPNRDSGLFRWSESVLAADEASIRSSRSTLKGKVSISTGVILSPGTRPFVTEILKKNGINIFKPESYPVGANDLVTQPEDDPAPLREALDHACRTCELLLSGGVNLAIDVGTKIAVPIETDPESEVRKGRASTRRRPSDLLSTVLPAIRNGLYRDGQPKSSRGELSIQSLADTARVYRLPIGIRRTVEYTFAEYSRALSNPHQFDAVLDLYDAMRALHVALTVELRKKVAEDCDFEIDDSELGRICGKDSHWIGGLDHGRGDQVAEFIETTYQALMQRVSSEYPITPLRDLDVNMTRGLTQMVLASDAVFKCGLGLVRRLARGDGSTRGLTASKRGTVGGVLRVGVRPHATCSSLQLGIEKKVNLVLMRANENHVLNFASYFDYLHECFHFIHDQVTASEPRAAPRNFAMLKRCWRTTVPEVFSSILSCLLVFPQKPLTFARFHVIEFSRALPCNVADAMQQLIEHVAALFSACDCIPLVDPATGELPEKPGIQFAGLRERAGEFIDQIENVLPLEERGLWKGGEQVGGCRREVLDLVEREHHFIIEELVASGAWKAIREVQKRVQVKMARWEALSEAVAKRIDIGEVVDRRAPELVAAFEEAVEDDHDGRGIDPLILICNILSHYLSQVDEIEDGEGIYLPRNSLGNIEFSPGRWHWRMVDQGATASFCCIPRRRRQRLVKQVSSLMSLWGASADLRSRRLGDMILASGLLDGLQGSQPGMMAEGQLGESS